MRLELLNKDCILIVPNYLKNNILKEFSNYDELFNIKFISREEFIDNSTFSYGVEAVLYLMDRYDYNSNVAKILIDNMHYVDKDNYPSEKLNELYNLKKELIENKLLVINDLFPLSLKNKKIYVYGYYYIDDLFKRNLKNYDYQILTSKDNEKISKIVYEADTLEEEVEFIFNRIGDLLSQGVSINNIKIVNYSDKYDNVLKKLSKFYNIPIEDRGYSIYGTEIVKDYLTSMFCVLKYKLFRLNRIKKCSFDKRQAH